MRQRGKVRWTQRAAGDLLAIGEFIAKDDPEAARRFVERLRQRARDVVRTPLAGRVVPEVERTDLREVFVGSYRIVYRVAKTGIEVLTVFEGHRLLPASFDARVVRGERRRAVSGRKAVSGERREGSDGEAKGAERKLD